MRTHVCVCVRESKRRILAGDKAAGERARANDAPFVLSFQQNCAHTGETPANDELANGDYVRVPLSDP